MLSLTIYIDMCLTFLLGCALWEGNARLSIRCRFYGAQPILQLPWVTPSQVFSTCLLCGVLDPTHACHLSQVSWSVYWCVYWFNRGVANCRGQAGFSQ